ncbi:MAG: phytanoyl-CoA dioxygenase family protein [bacterium]|nr:phytanoyl-CoA dioxygenase family protein [bacterium]
MKPTSQQIQQYKDNGFTIVPNVIPPDQLERIADRLNQAALGKLDPGISVQVEPEIQRTGTQTANPLDRIRKVARVVPHDPFFRDLACEDGILELARGFIGENIRFFGDECQLKPAFHGSAHAWHQDAPYFHTEPMPVVTLWMAIDDATEENGCIEVVPGLHKQGILERKNAKQAWFNEGEFDTSNAVRAEVKAGGVLVFDIQLPHGSGPNRTPNRRRSAIYRYVNVDHLTPEMKAVAIRHGSLIDDPEAHPVFRKDFI